MIEDHELRVKNATGQVVEVGRAQLGAESLESLGVDGWLAGGRIALHVRVERRQRVDKRPRV